MPPGRPPQYSAEVRAAYLEAVFVEGIPYTRAAAMLRAGEIGNVGAVPVSTSTCRGWRDKYLRDQAAAIDPDETTWRAIANDALRVLARETEKLTRDARKPKPLDPKRVREHLATIREARALGPQPKPSEDPQPEDAPQPEGLAERLAAQQAKTRSQAATTDPPPTHPIGEKTRPEPEASRDDQREAPNESGAASPVPAFVAG